MLRYLLFVSLTLLTVGCGPRYVDYFPYHDDGTPKPQVALVPVMVPTAIHSSSDLSRELTDKIRYEIMNEGTLFLFSEEEIQQGISGISNFDWFCNNEILAQRFCTADFIVLTELVEKPAETSCSLTACPCHSSFVLKMRVKVVDLRPHCPRVVLQEIMKCDYVVPTICEEIDVNDLKWDSAAYQSSQLARAHQRLAANVVRRVQEAIQSAY